MFFFHVYAMHIQGYFKIYMFQFDICIRIYIERNNEAWHEKENFSRGELVILSTIKIITPIFSSITRVYPSSYTEGDHKQLSILQKANFPISLLCAGAQVNGILAAYTCRQLYLSCGTPKIIFAPGNCTTLRLKRFAYLYVQYKHWFT